MIYVFFADGFEEVEALTPVDYLRRSGLDVCCVGLKNKVVKGSHGIAIEVDELLSDCNFKLEKSMIVLPGGLKGTENLNKNEHVLKIIKEVSNLGSLAAICAAPSILGKLNLLQGKRACCYPGFEKFLIGADVVEEKVVLDDNIITSRGAGTAQQFAFEIVSFFKGVSFCENLKKDLIWC